MTESELQNLINKLKQENEIPWIEVKDSLGDLVKIGETISALANSAGWKNQEYGYLIWGLENDTWKFTNTKFDLKKKKKGNEDGWNWILGKTKKRVYFEEFEFNIKGNRIYILKIKNCENDPVEFDDISYIRIKSSNDKLKNHKEILKQILNKNQNHDWSAQVCEGATVEDLDEEAILKIKKLWAEKTGKQDILKFDTTRLLLDLFETDKILKATLILLGKKSSIQKYGINTEISFHYRNNPKTIRSDDRKDFRRCFALEYDEIWNKIDARNEIFYFQKGLFLEQIMKFNEVVIREALLNCVAHRDYETEYSNSQIVINQSPEVIEFQNPGQLPTDTNLEKLIQTPSKPRNKKLAEVFQKLKLIEKSGFGVDLIVQKTISEGKGSPKYTNFDDHYVFLKLNANLQDEAFVRYLYKISKEKDYSFDALEVLTLEEILLYGETEQTNIKNDLLKQGFIEISGTGKGSKLILSKRYYELSGDDRTKYTAQKGLDEESCRQIIIKHLEHFSDSKKPVLGPELYELVKKISDISYRTFNRYIKKMVEEKIIKKRFIGKSKIEYKLWNDKWKDI